MTRRMTIPQSAMTVLALTALGFASSARSQPPKAAAPAKPAAWRVDARQGSKAKLAVAPTGVMKVDVEQLGNGPAWQIQLVGPSVAVKAKEKYTVSFRAKAAEPRSLVVIPSQGQPPWRSVGLFKEVSLTDQWQSFRYNFEASLDDEKAQLKFDLGSSAAAVELADVSFGPQTWFLGESGGAAASLVTPAGLPGAVRVDIGKVASADAPWSLKLAGPTMSLAKDQEMYVSFRARSDEPRKIVAVVGMAHPPWNAVGLYRPVELTKDWRSFGFTFKPTADESAAQLAFLLGGSNASVEIQSASVNPIGWKISSDQDHEAVLTYLSDVAGGMRVDFGKLAKTDPWRVQLAWQPIELKANGNYEISFRARADKPRDVVFGVNEGKKPWTNLGLYGKVPLTDKWQTITRDFTAKSDAASALLFFQLGGSDAPVEVADIAVGPAKPKPAAAKAAPAKKAEPAKKAGSDKATKPAATPPAAKKATPPKPAVKN